MNYSKGSLGYKGGIFNRFRSPLEKKVANEFTRWELNPEINYTAGFYEIDMAFLDNKLAIEIDGYAYHTSKEQKARDNFRQMSLEKDGWIFERVDGWFANRHANVLAAKLILKYFAKDFDDLTLRRAKGVIAVYFREIDNDLSDRLLKQIL